MIKAITHILKQDAVVSGLVGDNVAGSKAKVYPVFVPQGETDPYIVVRQTGKVLASRAPDMYQCTFDVYSYHKSYDETEAIDLAVVEAMKSTVSGEYNGVLISYINHENTQDQHVDEPKQLYVKVSTFSTMVTE